MGAHPYWYVVDYQPDVENALQKLRRREFAAGRYNPVTPFPQFPVEEDAPSPGARHGSIEEALADTDADGTRSILDLMSTGEGPDPCLATPMSDEMLQRVYETTRPTREMVEQGDKLFDHLDRGQGVYTVVYEGDEPDGLFFAGLSFD